MLSTKKLIYKTLTLLNTALNTSKNGTFTRAQSASVQAVLVKQYGKVVSVMGYLTGVNISGAQTIIGTLSDVSLPPTQLRFVCMVGANAYSQGTAAYGFIGTNGEFGVSTTNTGSNKAVLFNVTYTAD